MPSAKSAVVAGSVLLAASIALNIALLSSRGDPPRAAVASSSAAAPEQPDRSPILFRGMETWGSGNVILNFDTHGSPLVKPEAPPVAITPEIKYEWRCDDDQIRIFADFEPGKTYLFKVAAGLANQRSEKLLREFAVSHRIPQAAPMLRFLSSGLYLPLRSAKLDFPYASRNVGKVRVKLSRAYENNLNLNDLRDSDSIRWMKEVAAAEFTLDTPANAEVNHLLSLDPLLPKREPGVYRLEIDDGNRWSAADRCDFVLTDLGVQAVLNPNGRAAEVFVRTLSGNQPVPGAETTLLSEKNQLVSSGKTGADGAVQLSYRSDFDPAVDRPAGVLVKTAADLTYFRLDSPHRTASVAAEPTDRPRAFLFAERGVCRPGEEFELSLFVRSRQDGELKILPGLPVVLTMFDPLGKVWAKYTVTLDRFGYAAKRIALPADAALGEYRLVCGDGANWGETAIQAAMYIPDKLKVGLSPVAADDGDGTGFRIAANYYFGPQVSGGEYLVLISAVPGANPAHWPSDWTVGDPESFTAGAAFAEKGVLPPEGALKVNYPGLLRRGGRSFNPVRFNATATVAEPGGRGVSAFASTNWFPSDYFLGLRRESEPNAAGVSVALKLLPARDDGGAVLAADTEINFELSRIEWDYAVVADGGRYRREWRQIRLPRPADARRITVPKGTRLADFASNYRLETLPDGLYQLRAGVANAPIATVFEFFHARGESGGRPANPLVLNFQTDAEQYRPGAVAKVTFESPADGEATVVAGERGIELAKSFAVKAGSNTFELQIPAKAATSAYYAGVTLLTPGARSFGLLTLKVDQQPEHRLAVKLVAPAVAKPGEAVKIRVELADGAGRPQAGLVKLFAVDEGVLALTAYKTPDIYRAFFGEDGNPFLFYDVYGDIYPELKILPDGRIGGDKSANPFAAAGKLAELGGKKCARLLLEAFEVPAAGSREVEAVMPDHLGSLRLMAVAANAARVGGAEREIVLRDRIGASIAAPLVLAPGDRAELSFTLFNFELEPGDYRFLVTLPPMLQSNQTVFTGKLVKGTPLTVTLPVTALAAGTGDLKWELALGSEVKTGRERLNVRPVGIRQTRSETVALPPGQSATFAPDPADWEPGSTSRLALADGPAAKLGAALEWLQSYPYGCCEQTVAAAFPLLAADELVKGNVIAPELAEGYRQQLAAAYARLLAMRLGDGSFAMWPGGNEVWPDGSIFAAHFIFEAVNRKVIAPDDRVLIPLRNWLRRQADDASLENRMRRAYAVYVLAAAGDEAFVNPARNLLSRGQTDYASLLAALALVRGGYAVEATPALAEAVRERVWLEAPAFSFATPASQLGMTLYLLLDNNFRDEAVLHSMAIELARQLRSDGGNWGTTQANAWAVLGLGIYAGRYPAAPLAATLETNGNKRELACSENFELKSPVTVTNNGSSPLTVTRSITGIPRETPREAGSIKLKKEFLNAAGQAVDTVNHGDLVFIRLTIASPVQASNVVIADLLPAGLAIEDELLATRSALLPPELRAKYGALTPKLLEKRDDRLLIFGDLAPGTAEFTCRARAVTRGVFAVPPVQAEAMYHPDLNGVAGPGGVFTVK